MPISLAFIPESRFFKYKWINLNYFIASINKELAEDTFHLKKLITVKSQF